MAARIRRVATAGRFNATSLGNAVGVPSSSAAHYWSGKRAWPMEVLPELADALGVNVDFLLSGESLSMSTSAEAVGDRRSDYRAEPAANDDLVEVAQIDVRFGLGAAIMDEHAVPEMRSFSRAWLRQITNAAPDNLYWAPGRGDSMKPTINDGEIVLIDRSQQTPRDADLIWAFAWGDLGAIKRLRPMPDGSVKILSDNDQVPVETAVEGDIHIFGRVVAVLKKL